MKFSGKIAQLLMGTVGLSIAVVAFSIELQPRIANAAIAQIAQALSPEEVNLRAKQITVRIDGANVGSGSIINYSDKVYTVLTNWHVMKNSGEYTVQTIDGRKYQVDPASIKQVPGIDLAVLKFSSSQNYQVATTGDASNLNEGQSVYFAGYPGELRTEDNRYYRFFTASLVGILPKATENGYSIIYSGEAFPGMSGGPVFNQEGLMIGVHGEANINAISGGTSNYGIPINSYKSAIAKLNTTPQEPEVKPTPEVKPAPEVEPTEPENNQPAVDPGKVTSVPTFTPGNAESTKPPTSETPEAERPAEKPVAKTPEVEDPEAEKPESKTPEVIIPEAEKPEGKTPEVVVKPQPEPSEPKTEPAPTPNSQSNSGTPETANSPTAPRSTSLVSPKTGIDYTELQNLLQEGKWSEADIHTYRLVEQIIKTAKQENKHIFIELKAIAKFSCPDIRTIDNLWKKYSDNRFGFSSQQEVWQSVNQKGDFSAQTWRQFATEVGWKKGEVATGSGYLLYDQLNFDPSEAPSGHLPWWFALPDEEQKVIKSLFASCNFHPSEQELKAEAQGDKSRKPAKNIPQTNPPNIYKAPKSP